MSRIHADQVEREWLKISEAIHISGLGRTTIYALIADKAIKSALIRRRGKRRGARRINRASLLAFIEEATL